MGKTDALQRTISVARQVYRLAPGAVAAETYAKLTVAAGPTYAWADASSPRRFWLAEGTFVGSSELPAEPGAKVIVRAGDFTAGEGAVPLTDGTVAGSAPASW